MTDILHSSTISPWDDLRREHSLDTSPSHDLRTVPVDLQTLLADSEARRQQETAATQHVPEVAGSPTTAFERGPTEHYALEAFTKLRLKEVPQVMEWRSVHTAEGVIERPVAAAIRVQDTNKEVWLSAAQDEDGALRHFVAQQVRRQSGQYVDEGVRTLDPDASEEELFREGRARITLQHSDKKPGWSITSDRLDMDVEVSAASSPQFVDPGRQQERRARLRGFSRKLGAAALAYTMFSSGGLVDRAANLFTDPTGSIKQRYSNGQELIAHTPELQELASAVEADNTAGNASDEKRAAQATERMASLVDDLDHHRYDDIRQRAAQFKERYSSEFIPQQHILETLQKVDQAHSNEEIGQLLSAFMQFYDKVVVLEQKPYRPPLEDTPIAYTRDMAHGIVNTFGLLPKNLVEGTFGTIRLAKGGELSAVNGYYSPPENSSGGITLYLNSKRLVQQLNADPSASRRDIMLQTVKHELGHAVFGHSDEPEKGGYATNAPEAIARRLINRPNYISMYAATSNEAERQAEGFRTMFGGLRGPEETRSFTSGANTYALDMLYALDNAMPGFADYAIATFNARLFRSYASIGHFDPLG